MTKRFVMVGVLSLISLAAASAADKSEKFGVNLYQPAVVNGTAFKAGDAKIEIADGKATVKQGKTTAEVSVKVETAPEKFPLTKILYKEGNEQRISDIWVGGTNKHIVFQDTAAGQ